MGKSTYFGVMKLLCYIILFLCYNLSSAAQLPGNSREIGESDSGSSELDSFNLHSAGEIKVLFENEENSENSSKFIKERIVKDLIFIENGVDLDFDYNETASLSKIASAPGCPKSYGGRPWLYFGFPAKCYLTGFQGPCPWGQRFFSLPSHSKYGVCNCDCFANNFGQDSSSNLSIRPLTPLEILDIGHNLIFPRRNTKTSIFTTVVSTSGGSRQVAYHTTALSPGSNLDSRGAVKITSQSQPHPHPPQRYQFCQSSSFKRRVVYDTIRQECYPFLDQGPCLKGQWLIKDPFTENGVKCEKRRCPQSSDSFSFTYFDYKQQKCLTESFQAPPTPEPIHFFANAGNILTSRHQFCKDAGMKYSIRLKTCVNDTSSSFNFQIIG